MQGKFYSSDSLTKRKLSVIGRERQMPTTDSQREFSKLQWGRRGGTFMRSRKWSGDCTQRRGRVATKEKEASMTLPSVHCQR